MTTDKPELGTKIRLAVVAFAVAAGAAGWVLGWSAHGWAIGVYFVVIVAGLLTASGIDLARSRRLGFSPEDLDRPGGPYDRLHHRVK